MLDPVFAISKEADETIAVVFGIPVFGLLLFMLGLVIRDTIRRKGRWGMNLRPAACRKCGTPAPLVRKPASLEQALWGGWTCAECGFELDKWGEPVPGQKAPAKWKLLEAVEAEEIEEVQEADDSPSSGIKAPGRVKEGDEGKHHD